MKIPPDLRILLVSLSGQHFWMKIYGIAVRFTLESPFGLDRNMHSPWCLLFRATIPIYKPTYLIFLIALLLFQTQKNRPPVFQKNRPPVFTPVQPCMRFLFIGPGFCLRLPSDSASRRTPLPSASGSHCQAHRGLSPPS